VYADSLTTYTDQYNEKLMDITTSKLKLSMASCFGHRYHREFKILGYETPVGLNNPTQRFDGVSIYPTLVKRGWQRKRYLHC
jgi:hypothetical protein